MKGTNISRVRIKTQERGLTLDERLLRLERLIEQTARAVESDFNELDLNNLSAVGQKQLDERIKKIIDEKGGGTV